MHTTDLPTSAPREFTPGETLEWIKSFDDFPADTWTVTYSFRGAGNGFDVIGTAAGLDHNFTVPGTTSDNASPGVYYFQAWADDGAGEKHLVDSGQTQVLPNIAALAVGTNYDGRSQARIILEAIDALMLGKATLDQQKYLIATGVPGFTSQREAERIDPEALLALRKYYAGIVRSQNRRNKPFRTIRIDFNQPQ